MTPPPSIPNLFASTKPRFSCLLPRSRVTFRRGSAPSAGRSQRLKSGRYGALGLSCVREAPPPLALDGRVLSRELGGGGRYTPTYTRDLSRRVLYSPQQDALSACLSHAGLVEGVPPLGLDPYRGCEYGCVCCAPSKAETGAVSTQTGLAQTGRGAGRVFVKTDAARLLEAELQRDAWRADPVALGVHTDAYQPAEKHFGLTRRCLGVLARYRSPVHIVTKSQLLLRDLDLLRALAKEDCVRVVMSFTSLDARLALGLEPRAAGPAERLHAVHRLAEAGVPVGVCLAPVIPGLTEDEMPALLEAAAGAGAQFAHYALMRPLSALGDAGVATSFTAWLQTHVPAKKGRILSRLRALYPHVRAPARGEHPIERPYALHLGDLFRRACERASLSMRPPELSSAAFRRSRPSQLQLFESSAPGGVRGV